MYIRRVTKVAGDGWAKKVRDRRGQADLERVLSAQVQHVCTYHSCPFGGTINPGTPYLKVYPHHAGRRVGIRFVFLVQNYHLECLPTQLKPNLRFFGPVS